MFDDIALFIHIVQNRGLAPAAKALDLPAATVTRRLQKLESELGCQLLHRSARKFVLTAEGESYYKAYADLVHDMEQTARRLEQNLHQLSGRLRVMAPTNISIGFLQPMWSAFIREHPDIRLDLQLSNERKDILASQVDIALRVGPQPDSQLTQKKLGTVATILVASPDYLDRQGYPAAPQDLKAHGLISSRAFAEWSLYDSNSHQRETLRPVGATQVDDIRLVNQLACDGIGIALLPITEISDEMDKGKLERVLPSWQGQNRDIFAVWPGGRLLNAKAKCLRDYMQKYIAARPVMQGEC